jgi:PBP1b-binding outer membrane lipoprotein LpoB
MKAKIKTLTLLLAVMLLLAGCSTKITAPVESQWQVVPCEYKLTGDDESILQVRAQVADFDSAKIVVHTFHWTVYGDTLSRETTLFPRDQKKAQTYTIFTADRSLPVNSVLRSVELLVKK